VKQLILTLLYRHFDLFFELTYIRCLSSLYGIMPPNRMRSIVKKIIITTTTKILSGKFDSEPMNEFSKVKCHNRPNTTIPQFAM